ncbi:hypothetical protein [Nocardioides flavescens]|uniref:Secreted protein n=1 Tax=Nocardioides flavescens TaxID=2691959 RepID=A0A6L7F4D3_9ACTN|nr:hypothetical protein [Nocardioides flavescens]MXG92107.1 hypothetical protein [Nocardioides flavescens]
MLLPALLASVLTTVAAPALAAPAAPTADEPTLLTYTQRQGTVTLHNIGDTEAKLPGAPASFRSYARSQMRATWQDYLGGRPACKGVPHITVRGLRTDGFAYGDVSERPRPGCQDGGGYVAIWAVRKGAWKQVIGTQDVPTCARLEKLDIPSDIGVTQCAEGADVVDYVHD